MCMLYTGLTTPHIRIFGPVSLLGDPRTLPGSDTEVPGRRSIRDHVSNCLPRLFSELPMFCADQSKDSLPRIAVLLERTAEYEVSMTWDSPVGLFKVLLPFSKWFFRSSVGDP